MDPVSSAGSADVEGILQPAHGWGVGWRELDIHQVISERRSQPRSIGHCLRGIGSGPGDLVPLLSQARKSSLFEAGTS